MRRFLVVAVLAALTLSFRDVRAAPLDAATCGQLKGEQVRMEQGGVRDRMARGPSWAKANLTADKIDEVRRLIELDEQLLFRCSTRNLVELPVEADAEPAAAPPGASEDGKDAASPKADAPPAGQKKPAAKSAPAEPAKSPAAKAKPKEAAKAAPASPKTAPPAKKQAPAKDAAVPPPEKAAAAKPKPKAKVDDAYKAPAPNPSVDPFANQPARQ